MRYLLKDEDPNKPIYFGHHFKTIVPQGYFSGGAGYILSKEALRRFGAQSTNASFVAKMAARRTRNSASACKGWGLKLGIPLTG